MNKMKKETIGGIIIYLSCLISILAFILGSL